MEDLLLLVVIDVVKVDPGCTELFHVTRNLLIVYTDRQTTHIAAGHVTYHHHVNHIQSQALADYCSELVCSGI